jgi:hypothetical protein
MGGVEPLIAGVERLQGLLAPYAVGGEKAMEGNIPGVGTLEGGQGKLGSVIRFLSDKIGGGVTGHDAQNIAAAISGIVGPILRDQAGLAQTMSETNRVLTKLGLNEFTDEAVFLKALPTILTAINTDIANLKGTTMSAVKEYYETARGSPSALAGDPLQPLDFSQRGVPTSMLPKTTGAKNKKGLTPEEERELAELEKQHGGQK